MKNQDSVSLGSKTAKGGFANEEYVINKFNNWQTDKISRKWLLAMGYNLDTIEYVQAIKITGGYKADLQLQITISVKLKHEIDYQNIQVKLVSNKKGFNQIDKRWLDKYQELWNIPQEVLLLLKYYTGELTPYKLTSRDTRRMFATEFSKQEQEKMLSFLSQNKTLIISDVIKGRGKFASEWMLVIVKEIDKWALKPINFVLNHYTKGEVKITKQGNFRIGKITMQRKGGDGGRKTAQMLQFKIDPTELLELH